MIKSVSNEPTVLGATNVATANKENHKPRIVNRSESSKNLYNPSSFLLSLSAAEVFPDGEEEEEADAMTLFLDNFTLYALFFFTTNLLLSSFLVDAAVTTPLVVIVPENAFLLEEEEEEERRRTTKRGFFVVAFAVDDVVVVVILHDVVIVVIVFHKKL